MKVSDFIIEFLVKNGIDKVCGYIGANNVFGNKTSKLYII